MKKLSRQNLRQSGQMSIFLGISLLIIISFIAFVINVGLFVKAKINLQNAVDAAAFSGASVQSRQLTNIAYLNWEMRNTFKEWMFKYYILGQKGVKATQRSFIRDAALNPGQMNFRLRPFYPRTHSKFKINEYDRINAPTICIDYGSSHNICDTLAVPGLPRFPTVGLPSVSDQHESFLNSIVASKAQDCSSRSNVNLGAAMLWAYGTGQPNLFPGVPEIASHRVGAWVKAIEQGLRMRSLEFQVNTPPVEQPICRTGGGGSCVTVNTIEERSNNSPQGERPVKAFWSAYRNLAGGILKTANQSDKFAQSFQLTELKPTPFEAPDGSLSSFLIPNGSVANQKHYLDLQIYPINYATFYTTFVSENKSFRAGVPSEADCAGIKTALPVPGYLMGFTKNPEVLTYYAVKGEADFVGMFFPFTQTDGIKMSAYAAAKPFGGRIGPKIFHIDSSNRLIKPRTGGFANYTAHYAMSLDTTTLNISTGQIGGNPVPLSSDFWALKSTRDTIGGNPTTSEKIYFTIPNLIYDYNRIGELLGLNSLLEMNDIKPSTSYDASYTFKPIEETGLYDQTQFELFEANQVINVGSPIMTANDIDQSINNVRRPTKYEALNYLIPVMAENFADNPADVNHNSYIYPISAGSNLYRLYAPLFGPGALYNDVAQIRNVILAYINSNQSAVNSYLDGLLEISDNMRAAAAASTSGDAYVDAANTIHPTSVGARDFTAGLPATDPSCDTMSMAHKFHTFFYSGVKDTCGIKSLIQLMAEYLSQKQSGSGTYIVDSYNRSTATPSALMSAYQPGVRQGAMADGKIARLPFGSTGGQISSAKRNFYSTKLIGLDMVRVGSTNEYLSGAVSAFMEGSSGQNFQSPSDLAGSRQQNKLETIELDEYKEKFDH